MDYLHQSAAAVYRKRRRRRAVITLASVSILLVATLGYAASYVQGWVGNTPKPAANAGCPTTSNQQVTPSEVTVNVYNTTGRSGLAATVARNLERQGFQIGTIDNDPLRKKIRSLGEVRHGPNGTAGAALAAARLPGASLVLDNRTDSSVDLVLGNKFRTLSIVPKIASSKKAQRTPAAKNPRCQVPAA